MNRSMKRTALVLIFIPLLVISAAFGALEGMLHFWEAYSREWNH